MILGEDPQIECNGNHIHSLGWNEESQAQCWERFSNITSQEILGWWTQVWKIKIYLNVYGDKEIEWKKYISLLKH